MRNNGKRKRMPDTFYINDFPPNYSGQYTKEELYKESPAPLEDAGESPLALADDEFLPEKAEAVELPRPPETKTEHKNPIANIANLFSRGNSGDNGDGGLLGLFSGKKLKNIFTELDFEDLILLGVIFFLLKDGAEDELLIILAIILFTG